MTLLEKIELLIDECDKHLDGDGKGIDILFPPIGKHDETTPVHISDDRQISNIRGMAFALRNSIYNARGG